MKSLTELYSHHQGKVSDKWQIYLKEYEQIFEFFKNKPIKLLEIGIQNGGSLEILSQYFKSGKIFIGCDINPKCEKLEFLDERIAVIIGDANADETHKKIAQKQSNFDLIIDDGSHSSGDIYKSFVKYFPMLNEDGLFIVEDLHCSYWGNYEGGLYHPYSSIEFFKKLTDVINYEHWGINKSRTDILNGMALHYGAALPEEVLSEIYSIQFINSVCVIRKNKKNKLGKRIIAGIEETVVSGHHNLPDYIAPNQSENQWSSLANSPMESYEILCKDVSVKNKKIFEITETNTNLNNTIIENIQKINLKNLDINNKENIILKKNKEINLKNVEIKNKEILLENKKQELLAFKNSNSWKITKPLRKISKSVYFIIKMLKDIYQNNNVLDKNNNVLDKNNFKEWALQFDQIDEKKRNIIRSMIKRLEHMPKISVIMPTYNPNIEWLIQAVESLKNQLYSNWELCIADDASTNKNIKPILEELAKQDDRIKLVFRKENGHISAASNSAIKLATGEWLALFDQDDLLPEDALFWVANEIVKNPNAGLIYSDECTISETGERRGHYFKCDWNYDLFLSHNMISHLGVYRHDLVTQVSGFRIGLEGSQDHDLALRIIELLEPSQIIHIPRILYHWRIHSESTASDISAKPYALIAGVKAIQDHLDRQNIKAKVSHTDFHQYYVKYELQDYYPLVSIILNSNNSENIYTCILSILNKTNYLNYELIIICNNIDYYKINQYIKELSDQKNIKILNNDGQYNYCALHNSAVKQANGEYIVLLNSNTEVITPEWLNEMLSIAIQPGVGAVGARLWYPDDTLQHGGLILGIGDIAGHSHRFIPKGESGYINRARLIQSLSAVTSECLLVSKKIYDEVGGFDEVNLKDSYNDVDFCLSIADKGYRNVWTPHAELYHFESKTRVPEEIPEKKAILLNEISFMKSKWGDKLKQDPFYSPNLSIDSEDFSLAWPPRL